MHAIQHLFPTKKTLLLRLGAVALTLLLTAGLLSQAVFAQTTYVITDGDRVLVHTTYATDPAAVLTEAGLELGEEDTFTTQSDGNVSEITVNRIQMVRVNHDGQALEVATYGSTVSGILEQLGISTEGDLRISQSLTAQPMTVWSSTWLPSPTRPWNMSGPSHTRPSTAPIPPWRLGKSKF